MSFVEAVLNGDIPPYIVIPVSLLALFALQTLLPYLIDPYHLRSIPTPSVWAGLSDLWLARAAGKGERYKKVDEAHEKYGKVVRIAPDHVSIADPEALSTVYQHSVHFPKSQFYDAFVSIKRGLFNTRDRAEHARKRKIVSAVFSQKNVLLFEPYLHSCMALFVRRWDELCADPRPSNHESVIPAPAGKDNDKRVWFDTLPWTNFLAFDIIGDLAFGEPFGMLEAKKDVARVEYEHGKGVTELPAVQVLNERGEYSATMGVMSPPLRSLAQILPWARSGKASVDALAGIAIARVSARLAQESPRSDDILSRLLQAEDPDGKPLGRDEVTAEALTQLIAGSDTTSNSSTAILYYLARHRNAQDKLAQELEQIEAGSDGITQYETVKGLEYLQACIDESLRLHSTSALGLPRVIPHDQTIAGVPLKAGTVVSVPSYTLHRLQDIWGPDAEEFRPERWLERGAREKLSKNFIPFSQGPRACVGQNLAKLELQLIISTIIKRYDLVLADPSATLETSEGFLRKPLYCYVGMKRRE